MSSDESNDLVERLVLEWQAALQQHGFTPRGSLCHPFVAVAKALFPQHFSEAAEPDAAITLPGETPERPQHLIERHEVDPKIFAHANQELEAINQLGAMIKSGNWRIDRRKHYQVGRRDEAGSLGWPP